MVADPFHERPFRGSKGQGTRCTTCEYRLDCHPCCTCVPARVCFTLESVAEEGYECCEPDISVAVWDCEDLSYNTELACGDADYPWDFRLSYESSDGVCYAVLESEQLGLRLTQKLTAYAHCRCPSFDFDLAGAIKGCAVTLRIRAADEIPLGRRRCPSRGPYDCFGCRCLCRCLCLKWITAAHPEGVFTEACWYDEPYVDVECCCNGNRLPQVLMARLFNVSGCNLLTGAGPQQAVYMLYHEVIDGDHVWSGLMSTETTAPPYLLPTTIRVRCAGGNWIVQVDRYETDCETVTTAKPAVEVLSCNPFHLRTDAIEDGCRCASVPGWFGVDIQEFQGWIGPHPDGGDVTIYTNWQNTSDPDDATNCRLKMHIGSDDEFPVFENREDSISPGMPCAGALTTGGAVINLNGVLVSCVSCEACGEEIPDEPYADVPTCCCDEAVPQQLFANFVEVNNCPAGGGSFPLDYIGEVAGDPTWVGTGFFGECETTVEVRCRRGAGGGCQWHISRDGVDIGSEGFSCNPFFIRRVTTSDNTCCEPYGTPNSQYTIEVTE